MQKGFILSMIIVLAIFIGVMIVVQETNHPLMQQIVSNQAEILDLQRKIYRQATLGPGSSGNPNLASQPVNSADMQQKLNMV